MSLTAVKFTIRRMIYLGVVVICGPLAAFAGRDASAANGPQCQHALPAYQAWTPQEVWAWSSRICLGETADMSKFDTGDEKSCDPANYRDWPETRKLSTEFLDTILNREPYRSALHRSGVRINCALFSKPVNLSNMKLERPLVLTGSVFVADLSLISARISGALNLDGSKVNGRFAADNLSVGGNFSIRRKASFKRMRLTGAKVGGWMRLSGIRVDDVFDAERIQVEGSLLIDRQALFKQEVRLVSARIGGELRADQSIFEGLFSAARIRVAESLFMRDASFKDIRLIGAEIGGSLHLRKGIFDGDFDLTSASVADELQLNTPPGKDAEPRDYGPPRWADGARLILRNTRVGALNDTTDSWNGVTLDLVGFTYARLGGLRATKDSILAARPTDWLLENWLAKQEGFNESFIPQPFEQLAKVLEESGYPVSANEVRLAKLNHWRDSPRTATLTKVNLWLQYVLIGYGYRNWLAVLWFVGLVGLGAWVCGRSPAGREMRRSERFWYSVDIAVPVFDLDKTHAAIKLSEPGTVYFYFHKAAGFVLISFVIAGLSGLTK